MITIEAPAKINLTLEVLRKRDDGYHEIRSVIQALKFGDVLHFERANDFLYSGSMVGWSAEKSLVGKAVNLLREFTGFTGGVSIEVEKYIPLSSGMGGDSSDAAAVLLGLNKLWDTDLTQKKLLELADKLGSDVSFFIYGGTCLMEGRGEKVIPLPQIPHKWVILVIPEVPALQDKTRKAYAGLKPAHFTGGEITERFIQDLKEHRFNHAAIFNTFENIFFAPGADLLRYRDHILKIGAPAVHLSGSGPALFAMLEDKGEAQDLFDRLRNDGMLAHLTETK